MSNSTSKVDAWMAMMNKQIAPMQKKDQKANGKTLERVSLNFKDNLGRYQILPVDNVVNDYPYVTLFNTREINFPSIWTNPTTGEQKQQSAWIKILPKAAYIMKDATGAPTSSLTSEEEQVLNEAYMIFDQLFTELDAKNNRDSVKDLIRKRNYTIFNAYCVNKWDPNDGRTITKNNFSGLFVSTAKGFITAVDENINETTLTSGVGDLSWIPTVYNRKNSNREGYVMFNITTNKTTAGYTVTVTHKLDAGNQLKEVVIPEEDMELMQDPLANFLGWQAKKEEDVDAAHRRLFNASLIKQATKFMAQQLAAIRAAKSQGTTVEDAIKATNEAVMRQGISPIAQTNDPMLQQPEQAQVNMNNVVANNDAPFVTPPVSHVDPLSAAPESTNNFGFGQQQPSQNNFGGFGQNASNNSDLPF